MLFEVGRLCVKLAGRDANKKCVVVEKVDGNFVIIDGETRRRKCNVKHLEPLSQVLKLGDNASSAEVKKAFSKLGIELKDSKPKKSVDRPKKQKVKKNAPDKVSSQKAIKKTEPAKQKVVSEAPKAEKEALKEDI